MNYDYSGLFICRMMGNCCCSLEIPLDPCSSPINKSRILFGELVEDDEYINFYIGVYCVITSWTTFYHVLFGFST